MSTAIEFNHVSKQYRLGLVSTKTLSHDLQRWWTMNIRGKEDPYLKIGETNDRSTKGESDYVWTLKDIDFKVEQGDVVGIIGKNGAGKSTLLKLLSKVTGPTTGSIKARGRIGALLEVGTVFHRAKHYHPIEQKKTQSVHHIKKKTVIVLSPCAGTYLPLFNIIIATIFYCFSEPTLIQPNIFGESEQVQEVLYGHGAI